MSPARGPRSVTRRRCPTRLARRSRRRGLAKCRTRSANKSPTPAWRRARNACLAKCRSSRATACRGSSAAKCRTRFALRFVRSRLARRVPQDNPVQAARTVRRNKRRTGTLARPPVSATRRARVPIRRKHEGRRPHSPAFFRFGVASNIRPATRKLASSLRKLRECPGSS